jgi:hypothetical protein
MYRTVHRSARHTSCLPWGPGSLAHLGATRGRLSLSARARKLNSWMRYSAHKIPDVQQVEVIYGRGSALEKALLARGDASRKAAPTCAIRGCGASALG